MTNALQRAWTIAKKDMRIYYLRGPVIIFGILFPAFLFLAFALGRNVPPGNMAPGLIGMALFFTSSAVTPTVLPFETRTRTLERLLAAPVSIAVIIGGAVMAAFIFGIALSLVPIVISLGVIQAPLAHPLMLAAGVPLSALCFAILGSIFSIPPTDNPSAIMTISNLVRLPLIFISGVFLPVSQMARWLRVPAFLSPLTYTTELMRSAFGHPVIVPPCACLGALAVFCVGLWVIAVKAHRRTLPRRLSL